MDEYKRQYEKFKKSLTEDEQQELVMQKAKRTQALARLRRRKVHK